MLYERLTTAWALLHRQASAATKPDNRLQINLSYEVVEDSEASPRTFWAFPRRCALLAGRIMRTCATAGMLATFFGATPSRAAAEDFLLAHRKEIWDMVITSVHYRIGDEAFAVKESLGRDLKDPSSNNHPSLASDCSFFADVRFYMKYHFIFDNIDTSPFSSPEDFEMDRNDERVLRDPRKIVVKLKEGLNSIHFLYGKAWSDPSDQPSAQAVQEFAAKYASNGDMARKCEAYLQASGLK